MKRYVPTISILIVFVFFLSLFVGSYTINPRELVSLLIHPGADSQEAIILWQIRLPRALLALIAGAGLAVASALFQNTFRNRLADPAIIGISPAAAFGTLIALSIGSFAENQVVISLFALAATWATIACLFYLERHSVMSNSLLILGIAINALFSALIAVLAQMSNNPQSRSFVSWSMGSLATVTWPDLYLMTVVVLLAIIFSVSNAKTMDLLYISDSEIRGVNESPSRIRISAALSGGAIIALSTSVLGVISFIGLLVPNIVKAMGFYLHRQYLLLSGAMGAVLLLISDTLARTLIANLELPVSIFLVVIGVPFLVSLVLRKQVSNGA